MASIMRFRLTQLVAKASLDAERAGLLFIAVFRRTETPPPPRLGKTIGCIVSRFTFEAKMWAA